MSYSDPPPPPPPGYGGTPQPGYGGGQPAGSSSKATWALVTGLLSIFCCGPVGIAAILLSRSAKEEIATTGKGGSGLATAGLVLGIIGLVFFVLQLILVSTGAIDLSFDASTS